MERYWYAVGYYHGRSTGEFDMSLSADLVESAYQAYKDGFDCGLESYYLSRLFVSGESNE